MNGGVSLVFPFSMRDRIVRAFTLVEVLIVLLLMTTVLLLVNMALDLHLRQMVINRTEVEEAQLARIILEKIAQDIRSVVVILREEELEVDTAALTALTGLGVADMQAQLDMEVTEEYDEYEDYEEPIIYGVLPGIYGGTDDQGWSWIQIDTAKLPRGEMYGSRQVRRGTSNAADRLSASKTVLYYLGKDTGMLSLDDPRYKPEQFIGAIGRSLDSYALQYGLFRRQLDRQVMQYAIQEGYEFKDEQYDEPFAPEVEWIRFDYFDPTIEQLDMWGDWVEDWDMDERQMLPQAVRMTIAIRRPDYGRPMLSWGATENRDVIYSLVVLIPVSVDIPPTEEETDTEIVE